MSDRDHINDIIDRLLGEVGRDDDRAFDADTLIDQLADEIPFDEQEARRAKAKRAFDRRTKPDSSKPDGRLVIPGLEAFAYEPERLIVDDDGRGIELRNAILAFLQAEAERATTNEQRVLKWARLKRSAVSNYAAWVIEQMQSGRKASELIWDAFVRETGVWQPDDAPPEEGPDGPVAS